MGYRRRRRRCWVLNDFYETACCKFYRREHLPLHCTVLFFHPTYIIMAGFLLLGDGGICITHKQGLAFRPGYTFWVFHHGTVSPYWAFGLPDGRTDNGPLVGGALAFIWGAKGFWWWLYIR